MRFTRPFNKEELKKLFDVLHTLRMKAFIALAKDSGLNPAELLDLKVGDIRPLLNSKDGFAAIPRLRAKSSVPYYLCVGPEASKWIKEYVAQRERNKKAPLEDGEYLFTDRLGKKRATYLGIRQGFRRAKREVGLAKELTLYSIRKFTLTRLRVAGMAETMAKNITGHTMGVVDYYFAPSMEEVLDAYKKAYGELSIEGNGSMIQALQARLKELEQERERLREKLAKLEEESGNLSLIVKRSERMLSFLLSENPELKKKFEEREKESREVEEILGKL
jgi:integrase